MDINASESVFNQYSRFNYNVTQLFDRNSIYGSSDHNPEVVGINRPNAGVEIQILGTNDFHGRIANDPTSAAAGAAVMAGAVKQLRVDNANTVFAAAGDLIGASTFESFIDQDKPTIDALNSAGLEVSSVGNHEFDQGYNDLVNRVMAPYDATHQPEGWCQLGVHRRQPRDEGHRRPDRHRSLVDQDHERRQGRASWVRSPSTCPELVSPAGIADIQVTDIVQAVNDEADQLKADGAELVDHARARGRRWHRLRDHGRRPDVRLRQHHHRDRRRRRRDRLRAHPPRVQLRLHRCRTGSTRVAR